MRTNFGQEFYIPNQTISISTYVQKHLICELQLKEYMKVLWHILAVLCEMFSITYRDGWTGRGGHCMASTLA
jgi:hypothetical protein